MIGSVQASCIGTDALKTCTDNSGNSYTVSRMGNATNVQGYSANGGSWNQSTQAIGNTAYTHGTASNGASWNQTTQGNGMGGMTTYGTDSRGNSFHRTCDRYGNCY